MLCMTSAYTNAPHAVLQQWTRTQSSGTRSLPCPQVAYYCCKEHQARRWKRHKPVCEHLKELAQQKAPPS